jgi:hypothetical protein
LGEHVVATEAGMEGTNNDNDVRITFCIFFEKQNNKVRFIIIDLQCVNGFPFEILNKTP